MANRKARSTHRKIRTSHTVARTYDHAVTSAHKRRERDSNPRLRFTLNTDLANRRIRPLCHLSRPRSARDLRSPDRNGFRVYQSPKFPSTPGSDLGRTGVHEFTVSRAKSQFLAQVLFSWFPVFLGGLLPYLSLLPLGILFREQQCVPSPIIE